MSTQLLDYSDYHRTVIGYHGTSTDSADRLVAGEPFVESDQDNDWFGRGVYFWEHAFKQAWRWARDHKKHPDPAVIGAVIRLGNCFDFVDPGNVSILRGYHDKMVGDARAEGSAVPINVRNDRRLDCAVFNYLYDEFEQFGTPLDTARAVYIPTEIAKRVYKGSWISEDTHIQVCVRNPKSVLAVWHVREDGRYGKRLLAGPGE